MTPEEKITEVLEQIWNDSAINPDPKWVKFDFNYNVFGSGILSEDEERRILFKLEKEGVIKLHLSQFEDKLPKEVVVATSDDAREFLSSPYYWVEILDGFEEKYRARATNFKPRSSQNKNKNKAIDSEKVSGNIKIGGDYVAGDKLGRDKNISNVPSGPNWFSKFWWMFLVPVVVVVVGFIITEGKLPKIFQSLTPLFQSEEANILDRSVFQLVAETDYGGPVLDIQKRWQGFAGLKAKDEHATIMNYGDANLGKTWVDFKSVDSYGDGLNVITCVFNSEWRQKIELLGDSNKEVIFNGTIRGDLTLGRVPILEDCSVKGLPDDSTSPN